MTAIASCSCEPLEKFSLNPKYSETYVVFGQVNMITADHSGILENYMIPIILKINYVYDININNMTNQMK